MRQSRSSLQDLNDLPLIIQEFIRKGKAFPMGPAGFDLQLLMDLSRIAGHDIDAVRQQDRLIDVMGDEQCGKIDLLHHIEIPFVDLSLGNGIQRGKRFIQKRYPGL